MTATDFELLPAYHLSFGEQAEVFNRAFHGYLAGWHDLDAAGVGRFICAQGIDLCYSRFISQKGQASGFGYINRTGNISRLSGMGVIPGARRSGAAAHLLDHLLGEAKARTDGAMVLEVFEQNHGAVKLYQNAGFETISRLFGWRMQAGSGDANARVEEVSLTRASQLPSAFEYPGIPWQISRHAVSKIPVARAYCVDNACVVIGDPAAESIRIHACFAETPDWNGMRAGLAAVLGKFVGREFFAPPIFPEEFGSELFKPLAFEREALNQLLMRREL